MNEDTGSRRRIRSFVRREGRMTDGQTRAYEDLWPRYGIDAPAAAIAPQSLFARDAGVVLEIGFGNGDHLLARAAADPDSDFIGVEVHRPGCGRVMLQADKLALANLRVSSHDAVEVLRDWLLPDRLAEVVIYFPDPWHKKRHNKRRLVQPEFLALVASRLRPGGLLRMATDWAPYAVQMLEALQATPALENLAADGGYAERPESRPKTRFEARGERLGHEVFDLLARRRPD